MYQSSPAELKNRLQDADAVLIGASNGLSMAEGYNIFADYPWFQQNFGDFRQKYGVRSVLDGAFYPYPSLEEKWGFTAQLASKTRFRNEPSTVMQDLKKLVDGRDVFVLTTNADDSFGLAGFDPSQVFAMEGDIGEMRCSAHCGAGVVRDLAAVRRMAEAEKDGRVPQSAIPRCEKCGSLMEPNAADSQAFFQTEYWQNKAAAFRHFTEKHAGDNVAVLEIGVGPRNQMLLGPIQQFALSAPNASYTVLNMQPGPVPTPLSAKTGVLSGDIASSLHKAAQV